MSSTQSFTTSLGEAYAKTSSYTYYTFDLSSAFPNDVAKPIKADLSLTISRDWHIISSTYATGILVYNGTEKINFTNATKTASTQSVTAWNGAEVVNYNRPNTTIQVGMKISRTSCSYHLNGATATLYFTRYDFTATAGSNVTAASVSSSTGYDGGTIQYRCTLADGATWQGWYRNGSLYSSTKDLNVTVSGTDLALEARATSSVVTKTLSATYNNAQISGFPKSVQSAVGLTYGGASAGSIPISGGTKTFTCGGKLTASAIGIGGTTLNNSGKMMATDVVVTVS